MIDAFIAAHDAIELTRDGRQCEFGRGFSHPARAKP
jgi:hypothetical protein